MRANQPTWQVAFQRRQDNQQKLTSDEVLQFLYDLEKKGGLPVQQCLEIVLKTKAETCSITQDDPFMYFYVRRQNKELSIRFRTKDGEVAITIPQKKWLNQT